MTRRVVAGVDSSTQSCKVELHDLESGDRLGGGTAPHPPVYSPSREQHPEAWWEAFRLAWYRALQNADTRGTEIVAISVAAQCHGLIVLDARGTVLRPAKLWNDTTCAADLEALKLRIGTETMLAKTGTIPTAAFTIGKLAWLARVEPATFAQVAHIMLPHDYLTFRLTGERVTDRSEASGTGYYDADTGRYLPEFLSEISGETDWLPMLPAVLAPDSPAGVVGDATREDLGLGPGVIVGAGGGDQHAAALGLGVRPRDVVYSFGTSGVISALSRTPVRDIEGFVDGVADMTGGYMPLVSTLNAARVTDTFARLLGVGHDALSRLALAADANGPVLAPYFDGERTPDRPGAVGIMGDLTIETTREQVARAAYEGVVLSLVEGQRHLERLGVDTGGRMLATGGGTRSPAYLQLLADTTGRNVELSDTDEVVARGAAIQAAAVATGNSVATMRDLWVPRTTVAACPRPYDQRRHERFRTVTAITDLDRQ